MRNMFPVTDLSVVLLQNSVLLASGLVQAIRYCDTTCLLYFDLIWAITLRVESVSCMKACYEECESYYAMG